MAIAHRNWNSGEDRCIFDLRWGLPQVVQSPNLHHTLYAFNRRPFCFCRYEMICGLKHTASLSHTLWSCQMEVARLCAHCAASSLSHPPFPLYQSVRKDIECCFGILKMRFTILSRPLQCVRALVFVFRLVILSLGTTPRTLPISWPR